MFFVETELCPDVIAINACGAKCGESILVGESINWRNRSSYTMIALYPDDSGWPMRSTEICSQGVLGMHWVNGCVSLAFTDLFLASDAAICVFSDVGLDNKATNSFV